MKELQNQVETLVKQELERANKKFPLFSSPHEAYAIIKEEIEEATQEMVYITDKHQEIWKDIKNNCVETIDFIVLRNIAMLLSCEAIQIAAMAQKAVDSNSGTKIGSD